MVTPRWLSGVSLYRQKTVPHLNPNEGENEMLDNVNGVSADDIQAGGSHYKDMGVQPWTVMEALLTREEFIGYLKGNLIKYGMRQGKKDSPDAEKWHHYNMKLKEITNGNRS
jgi:hypothetical protein